MCVTLPSQVHVNVMSRGDDAGGGVNEMKLETIPFPFTKYFGIDCTIPSFVLDPIRVCC